VNKSSPLRRRQGFTLIEVMVVMVLISIIITFAVLSIDTGPEELRREGARLASLLDLASEDAVFNGRDYRVLLQRQGYTFEEYRDSKWQASADELLKPRTLPDHMHLELTLENEPVMLAPGFEPDPKNSPALLLLSSGEIPSFELIVSAEGSGKFYIRGQEGRIISGNPEDDDLL
jgi:general secretion pathway protein H